MKRKRKGGLTKSTPIVYNNNIDNNNYRVLSINKNTKEIIIIGTYNTFQTSKAIADGIVSNNPHVKCYVHSKANRVVHIAGE